MAVVRSGQNHEGYRTGTPDAPLTPRVRWEWWEGMVQG